MSLVGFVHQTARVNRGMAAYCSAGQLGTCVLESFIEGRRERRRIG